MVDILTMGEALVEIMRTEIDKPLDKPALFTGPYPSGAPFIFAMQVARLSPPTPAGAKVAAIGAVGRDAFGDNLLNQFRADGIDIRGVKILDDYATGVAFVAYAGDGSRDFVFHIKQAAAGQLHADMLTPDLFFELKCLHLMGSTLSIHDNALNMGLQAVEMAQTAGAKISFDPNLRPQLMPNERAREVFAPILEAADVIIPTAEELKLLTGQASLQKAVTGLMQDKPERVIVVTQGADGCTVYHQGNSQHIAGFDVQEVDPTGAGDCFDAGFLVRWLAGDTPEEAAKFANACGALAVTAKGPAEGAYSLERVQDFIRRKEEQKR